MKISTTTSLILLGLGALAIYKYNSMSDEEKEALKEKAKKVVEEHVAPILLSALGITDDEETATNLQEAAAPIK